MDRIFNIDTEYFDLIKLKLHVWAKWRLIGKNQVNKVLGIFFLLLLIIKNEEKVGMIGQFWKKKINYIPRSLA